MKLPQNHVEMRWDQVEVFGRDGVSLGKFDFKLLPVNLAKPRRMRKRMFVRCVDCGRWIEAGHLHQHVRTEACQKQMMDGKAIN